MTDLGKYILKNANINKVNNPQNEPPLCEHLLAKGLPVSEFIKNIDGNYIFTHDDNMYHMQKFIEGKNYEWNEAPNWLLRESAQILGKIHTAFSHKKALMFPEELTRFWIIPLHDRHYEDSIFFPCLK